MKRPVRERVSAVIAMLRRKASKRNVEGMARYGIPSGNALGVSVGDLRKLAKTLGRDHDLAEALWDTGIYEARMLASFVDDPARVTPAQMDRWCRDFDSWAIVDTVCFHLFDKTPHGFRKAAQWSRSRGEFQKRAAFALLASLAAHDREAPDEHFRKRLPLIEKAAKDERNFVKKGVLWALRAVGERSLTLHAEAVAMARRLATSTDSSARWVGASAARELTSKAATKRLTAKRKALARG
ncbi:MAG TPA: DNA alkylation repair protein [Candidatus Eisenbacteria bacterium]|nr:DNA alkylation repair protein [Candidatus Eisenbacteria bacterium]